MFPHLVPVVNIFALLQHAIQNCNMPFPCAVHQWCPAILHGRIRSTTRRTSQTHFQTKTLQIVPLSQKFCLLSNRCKRRSKRASQKIWPKQLRYAFVRAIHRALKRSTHHCCSHTLSRGAKMRIFLLSGPWVGHDKLLLSYNRGASSWAVSGREVWFGMHWKCS